jgi:integrase/recombinase XerC
MTIPPPWLQSFLDRLAAEDLSAATRRGYRYDLLQFVAWYTDLHGSLPNLPQLTEHDVIAWRQHMLTLRQLKATTINRRLEAVRRLLRWAETSGAVATNVARDVKTVRVTRNHQPAGLTASEVHVLLRAAGESSHGLARRNYALVQLMLQAGLRVGEMAALRRADLMAALRRADLTLRDRTGSVRIRHGKGLKEREVPLNATARRALRQLFEREPAAQPEDPVFRSTRNKPLPVRSIQNTITGLVRRAGIKRAGVSAHSLRHTFALAWLRQHPGQLVELAQLLGHESLNTTALYTRASTEELARGIEQTLFNLDG